MADNSFTILLDNSDSQGGKQDKKPTSAPKATQSRIASSVIAETPRAEKSVESIDDMFSLAREWVGHPYLSPSLVMQFGEQKAVELTAKRSGSKKRAIDCSDFAQEVLKYAGLDPPGDQTAEGLYRYFKRNGTTLQGPQKGALVFFEPLEKQSQGSGTWDAGREITHVAFASGGGKIIDSSSGRGVSERSLPPPGKFKYHYVMPRYKFGGGVS